MNNKLTAGGFDHRQHLYILKILVITTNLICLFLYAFMHVIFYDIPFVLQDELLIVLNLAGWATGAAVALSFILFAVDGLSYIIRHRKQFKLHTMLHVSKASQP